MSRGALFPPTAVRSAAARAFEQEGVPTEVADSAAEVLVDAEVRGHPSHGLGLLPVWLERIRESGIAADAQPRVLGEPGGPVTCLDAGGGLGTVAALRAAEICAEQAGEWGVGVVAVGGANHVGMLAAYRRPFAERDVVGLILNVSGPSVAPPGGAGPAIGNNAICLVVPRRGEDPLIADFACGTVACGKVRIAASRGESVPADWLVDRDGRPSTDPADLDAGGAVPLFGAHKGLCTALLAEVLAGMLGGGVVSPLVRRQRAFPGEPMGCAQLFVGFSPDAFGNPDLSSLSKLLETAIGEALPEGAGGDYFPEQAERRAAAVAAADGIEVAEPIASLLGLRLPAGQS